MISQKNITNAADQFARYKEEKREGEIIITYYNNYITRTYHKLLRCCYTYINNINYIIIKKQIWEEKFGVNFFLK